MESEKLERLKGLIDDNKGKRKFVQSVELAINFSGINFTKAENRINIEVTLPNGRGKSSKAVLFADDDSLSSKAKEVGATVVRSSELQALQSDKARMNELLKSELMAQPNLMPQIAKALGQFLGPRNKMPRPFLGGDIAAAVTKASSSIYLRSKGKYLPTVHCMVGKENMDVQKIAENIDSVVDSVVKQVGKHNLKSVYVKLTMSAPLRIV